MSDLTPGKLRQVRAMLEAGGPIETQRALEAAWERAKDGLRRREALDTIKRQQRALLRDMARRRP